jgi:hypothetical protein
MRHISAPVPRLVAVDEQARTRARREKGEIEAVGGDSDNTLDLGPAHQQLHRDPGTE